MQNSEKVMLRKQQLQKLSVFLDQNKAGNVLQRLYRQLFLDPHFLKAKVIGVTLSMAGELPTQPIIDNAMLQEKQVVIPRTLPHRQMEFVVLDEATTFKTTKFGTREPIGGTVVPKSAIDLLIVPGLAFSENNDRLGFGGGYYDRFLADFKGSSIAVAAPPQFFKMPIWPIEQFDIKITKVIH
ncbi:5-formyltetrahydrofolate cyclo-ligase [Lentilactobacillus raoultii]|uniref:5-formyltetrahydrofolate cyclo-ligase n=1 Tax=Lentilactobacillus raoultii TaxID=1987503 RepID=A0ABW3PV94_9LACO|nr:5-formyltetrahydrofolate cyclo-ligase [Lentilactobacillus raoultii]